MANYEDIDAFMDAMDQSGGGPNNQYYEDTSINPDSCGYTRTTLEGNLMSGFVMRTEEVGRNYHQMLKNLDIDRMNHAHNLAVERDVLNHQMRMEELSAMSHIMGQKQQLLALESHEMRQTTPELLAQATAGAIKLLMDESKRKPVAGMLGYRGQVEDAEFINAELIEVEPADSESCPTSSLPEDYDSGNIPEFEEEHFMSVDFTRMRMGGSTETKPQEVRVAPAQPEQKQPVQRKPEMSTAQGYVVCGTDPRRNVANDSGGGNMTTSRQQPVVNKETPPPSIPVQQPVQPKQQPVVTPRVEAPAQPSVAQQGRRMTAPVTPTIGTVHTAGSQQARPNPQVQPRQGIITPDSEAVKVRQEQSGTVKPVHPAQAATPKPQHEEKENAREEDLPEDLRGPRETDETDDCANACLEDTGYIGDDDSCDRTGEYSDCKFLVEETVPNTGCEALDGSDIAETVPTIKGTWVDVLYDRKMNSKVDYYFRHPGIKGHVGEYSHTEQLSVYRHKVYDAYKRHVGDDVNDIYWDAFDISVRAIHWKRHVARFMNGLTDSKAAIVRMLNTFNINKPCFYLAVYFNGPELSQTLESIENEAKTPQERYASRILYYDSMKKDPAAAHFISMLEYAYFVNKRREFTILEQIADYVNNGDSRMMLSPRYPKTEYREEYNIFSGRPEFVITNYVQKVLLCSRDEEHGCWQIKRMYVR